MHELYSSKINHLFSGFVCLFIISCKSAKAIKPCECTLDDPSGRFRGEAPYTVRGIADLKFNVKIILYRLKDFPSVSAVSQNFLNCQPYVLGSAYEVTGESGVMYARRVNASSQNKAVTVYYYAAFLFH